MSSDLKEKRILLSSSLSLARLGGFSSPWSLRPVETVPTERFHSGKLQPYFLKGPGVMGGMKEWFLCPPPTLV